MNKLSYIDFSKQTPVVSYTNTGTPPVKWKFFWVGIFGAGYYALTVNNRRHPKGKFKTTTQVWREYQNNFCITL